MNKLNIVAKEIYDPKKHMPKKHPMLGNQYNVVFDRNGEVVIFSTGVNKLNNKWMYWFSISPLMYSGNKNDVKRIVNNIRNKTDEVYADTFAWVK